MPTTTPVRTLDDAQTVSFQMPLHLCKWLDNHAAKRCATKSQVLRDLVLDLKARTDAAVPSIDTQDAPARIMSVREIRAEVARRKGARR